MLLFHLLLALLPVLPMPPQWQRIQTDEKISFLLPDTPQKTKKTIQGIPSTVYQAKNSTCIAGVVCSDLAPKRIRIDEKTAALFYQELKNSTLQIETALLKKEQSVPFDNMIIKEIEYTIIKDKHEMTYFKRFIFRDNYIYQISIGGKTRDMEILKQQKDQFFQSVSFGKDFENRP